MTMIWFLDENILQMFSHQK